MSIDTELDAAPAPTADQMASKALSVRIPMLCRYFRKTKGLTLATIAGKMGTTPQTIQRLETGGMTMSLEWLESYMDALGLGPEAFFSPGSMDVAFKAAEKQVRAVVAQKLRHIADNVEAGNI
jgi:transcriptional regulator with XRE-family HTH domain